MRVIDGSADPSITASPRRGRWDPSALHTEPDVRGLVVLAAATVHDRPVPGDYPCDIAARLKPVLAVRVTCVEGPLVADALALLTTETVRKAGKDNDRIRPNSRVVSSIGHAMIGAHVADIVHSVSTGDSAGGRIDFAGIVQPFGWDVVTAIVEDKHAAIERAADEIERTKRLLAPH